jgi:hypothetical protein
MDWQESMNVGSLKSHELECDTGIGYHFIAELRSLEIG